MKPRNAREKWTADTILLYKGDLLKEQYVALMLWTAGRSYGQIANELQIPLGTVKSRVSRGCRNINKIRAKNNPNITDSVTSDAARA